MISVRDIKETSKCIHITDFQTPLGLYQFKVMPFGFVNASVSFSRLMKKLLEGVHSIYNFIDDVIIYVKSGKSRDCGGVFRMTASCKLNCEAK